MNEDGILGLVGQIYDAATDPARLSSIGSLMARAVEAESALVFLARRPSARLVQLVSATANFDVRARADYDAYYHDRNEWFRRGVRSTPPLVTRGGELIDYADFDRTEFCNDWCRRVGIYHLLAATFPIESDVVGAIGIHRDRRRRAFSQVEKRWLAAVAPHLMRALQIAAAMGVRDRERLLDREVIESLGLGVMLVDENGRVLLANGVAERALRAGRWLSTTAGGVRATHPAAADLLGRALRAACRTSAGTGLSSGGIVRLRDALDQGLRVLVSPFRAASTNLQSTRQMAAVLFADPDQSAPACPEDFAAAWGLTPAEARLASSLVQGATLAGYARRAAISINTAKAQLRRVFLKTGTSHQSALVGMVLRDSVGQLRRPPPALGIARATGHS